MLSRQQEQWFKKQVPIEHRLLMVVCWGLWQETDWAMKTSLSGQVVAFYLAILSLATTRDLSEREHLGSRRCSILLVRSVDICFVGRSATTFRHRVNFESAADYFCSFAVPGDGPPLKIVIGT